MVWNVQGPARVGKPLLKAEGVFGVRILVFLLNPFSAKLLMCSDDLPNALIGH